MADAAGLGIDGGLAADFGIPIGKLDGAVFILDADGNDFLLAANIADDLVNVFT